ncbi:inositol hexakisphosphate kinase 3-like isoform X2 [Oratosquilla oratoria]|uniref:inositol hexakisphosphate kinase 3-like isoform X2 n=1 Tax=Oratosquilla oratoria TaxID=337810 RepID=UPI003F76C4ED
MHICSSLSSMTLGTMNHDTDKEELIQLEPLMHQVGGHSSMFVLDDVTVCKPLIGREYRFYRTLPVDMKRYTPEFRGTLQVMLQEEGEMLTLAALPNEQTTSLLSSQALKHGLRRVSSGSVDLESEGEEDDDDTSSAPSAPATPTSTSGPTQLTPISHPDTHSPWLLQSHQSRLHKLKQKSDSSNVLECIMLENLTFKYHHPCVLDLKMGTRQYGDDAPDSKRKSQTAKAAVTTTVTLGVRLAGMQVYNRAKKVYIRRNKYHGRQLSEEGFKQTIWQFLHNGKRLRLDIVEMITVRLEELRAIIAKLDSFRFFTSSLLILYDGYEPCSHKSHHRERDRERERGRDRERDRERERDRGRERESKSQEAHRHKNRGDSRSEESTKTRDRESWPPPPPPRDTHAHAHDSSGGQQQQSMEAKHLAYPCQAARDQHSKNDSDQPHPYKSKGRHKSRSYSKPRVDIRLIDFAHATHKGMGDSKVYSGADDGILLGLDSLIKIFCDIRDK